MASKVAVNRLRKEYKCFESPPFIRAAPLESNLQEWHYVLQGPPDSPYEGGMHYSVVKVPWPAAAHATSSPLQRPARLLLARAKSLCRVDAESRRQSPCRGHHPKVAEPKRRGRSIARYHGKVVFPNDYPFKPPSIFMLTPNGRFETGRRLCLSMSDFHPESWVPAWSVAALC